MAWRTLFQRSIRMVILARISLAIQTPSVFVRTMWAKKRGLSEFQVLPSLNVQVLLFLLHLCKSLLQRHVQVGARIEVENSNEKHRGGPPLSEAVGAYVYPRLCRYLYLYCLLY